MSLSPADNGDVKGPRATLGDIPTAGGRKVCTAVTLSLHCMHSVHCLHMLTAQCSRSEVFAFLFCSIPLNISAQVTKESHSWSVMR